MRIPAIAYCYGDKNFTGQIDFDLIHVCPFPSWYRIDSYHNVAAIKGGFKVTAGQKISGSHFNLSTKNFTIEGSGIIKVEKDTLFNGYIGVDDEYGPLVLSSEMLKNILIDNKTWIKLTSGQNKNFIADDPENFSKRPFGYCHIYCAPHAESLPNK